MVANFEIEKALPQRWIVGIDEVGRGPWAGPVTAAAVILDPDAVPEGLDDSKKLSEVKRRKLSDIIHGCAHVGIGEASVAEIDEMNILEASHLAMRRAVEALEICPEYALVDGNRMPRGLPCGGETLVKGDARSASIAAASIVAKVHRDAYMQKLAEEFPQYGWQTNKGYGTQEHQVSLLSNGPTLHHRRSFKPIHNILYPAKS